MKLGNYYLLKNISIKEDHFLDTLFTVRLLISGQICYYLFKTSKYPCEMPNFLAIPIIFFIKS